MASRTKTLTGKVVSNKMDKTVVVLVSRQEKHPVVGKIIRKSTKLKAHDADNALNIGDVVEIAECKPISKDKSWTLSRVIEKAPEEDQ